MESSTTEVRNGLRSGKSRDGARGSRGWVEGGVEDTVKWEERRLAEVLQEPQNAAFAIKAFGTRPRPPMDIGREAWMLAAFVRPADKMSSSTLSTLSSKEWRRERKGSEGGVVRQR